MSWDAKWRSLGHGREKRNESQLQRQFLINSSDEDTEDEEWIQQLQRDYGKKQSKRKNKWTNLEKLLLAALACSVIFISVLMATIFYSRYKHGETLLEFTLGGQKFCNELRCVEASHRVTTFMNYVTDPCNDFYDHACGSFVKSESIPSTHTKWSSFGQVSDSSKRKLKTMLDNLELGAENSDALHKVKTFYQSCLKKDFIEAHSNESLIWLINDVGGWTITNSSSWNEERWNFDQVLSKIHHLKSMPLFYTYVAPDDHNSTQNIIQIEQSGVTLPDETMYERDDKNEIVEAYKTLMIKIGILLGANYEQTVKQMNEIYEFEKKLSQIYENKTNNRRTDQIYHKMTIAELQSLCPAIPWLDYMNSMFTEPVKSSEEVIVYTPTYFRKMSELVIKTERRLEYDACITLSWFECNYIKLNTEKRYLVMLENKTEHMGQCRVIANYMVWHLIKPILPLLSKPFRNAALELAVHEIGLQGTTESWKNCVTKTDSVLGFATGHLFVKHMEATEKYSVENVKKMLDMIKEEFILNLRNVNWMDKETKKRAKGKALAVINMIGHPDWIKDTKKLDNYYQNFTITENPLKNYFNARRFYHEKTMQRRGKPVERNEWHMAPTEVNAYYNAPNNYIAFPSGILQPPFFDDGYPKPINYGALGFIIAHEFTHGFDSQGRYFDESGNMNRWWSNASMFGFLNQTDCIKRQYTKYEKKDSDLSLPENIADNGGIKIAFKAYKAHAYIHGEDQSLPGLKVTNDQLFFLAFAQTWCTVSTKEKKETLRIIDAHSSEKTRVNVALMNSIDFSKAYKCPSGSPMNPTKKCFVW